MPNVPGKPFANTRLVAYLEKRILELKPKKTQSEIAAEAGFVNPSMLSMIKIGASKLPIERILDLAKALECDAAHLFLMAYGGSPTELLMRQISGMPVTANEAAWLEEIRRASDYRNPSLTTRARAAIRGIFGK